VRRTRFLHTALALRYGVSTSSSPSAEIHDTLVQNEQESAQAADLSRWVETPPGAVPGYTLLRSLGGGAFGTVWLACEENTGKQVAIKFYTHQRGLDWSLLNREVEKLAVLYTSRHIVRLIDVGWNSEPPYYVMEYLASGSLATHLAAGPLPVNEAVRIAEGVLSALVHAHGSGILHCDLKPANVLLDNEFEPRLCDFGQSRLSNEQNPALGSLFYMAPEQADLEAIPDARWDVYALGALLYHMLCGKPPYWTPEIEEEIRSAPSLDEKLAVYRERIRSSPRPTGLRNAPGVDRRLAEIVDRCLQTDSQRRYPNAQAVLDMLVLRDRSRARRPLISLGIVGPSLLLLGMAWLVFNFLGAAEKDANVLMVRRANESGMLSARIVAQSIGRDLSEREQELIEFSDRITQDKQLKTLRDAIRAPALMDKTKNDQVFAELNAARKESDERFDKLGLQKDFSWFLIDDHGFQKWRSPLFEQNWKYPYVHGKSYASRDYFHGLGINYDHGKEPPNLKPIRVPHISQWFTETLNSKHLVAISVPIFDEADNVIGVLGRTIEIGSLLDVYSHAIFAEAGTDSVALPDDTREIALIERSGGNVLDHTWFDKHHQNYRQQTLKPEQVAAFQVSERVREKLQRLARNEIPLGKPDSVVEDHYTDPLSKLDVASKDLGGEWLAAFASVPWTDWVAVVQERRIAALEPVQDMKSRLTRTGLWALLGSCLLISVLWYFVGRALIDRTPRFWPMRPNRTGPGGVAASGSPTPSGSWRGI
jgi:eukaryotic-like serine/threonine-protein kinase